MNIPVEVSARHVHLKEEDFKILFGDKKLKIKKYLSQPGQFVYDEKIKIENNGKFLNASVLGPFRKETQVEISVTDSRALKINTPIRESGNLSGSPGCAILGPNGKVQLHHGVIVAKRHIHVNPEDEIAKFFHDGDECSIEIRTQDRHLILCKTVIRISKKFKLAVHIDTDEANSAGIFGPTFAKLIIKGE